MVTHGNFHAQKLTENMKASVIELYSKESAAVDPTGHSEGVFG